MDYKEISEIFRNWATVGGALLALIWFLRTRAYKRRSEIDLECRVLLDVPDSSAKLVEIGVRIDNKGEIDQRVWGIVLWLEELVSERIPAGARSSIPRWRRIGEPRTITPKPEGAYRVRAGIGQTLTADFVVAGEVSAISVTATLHFEEPKGPWPPQEVPTDPFRRTLRRVFDVRQGTPPST